MKLKKIFVTTLAGVIGATSLAFGTSVFQNKKVNYAINLIANGSPYTVQAQALKPFTTDDGYTYLSVRSLSELGLVDINYAPSTKTVTVNAKQSAVPGEIETLNQRIAQLTNENAILKLENTQLKEKLSSSSRDSSNSSSSNSSRKSDKVLNDLSSSERRELQRDIARDLQRVRLSSSDYGRSSYEADVTISRDRIKITLTDTDRLNVERWNELVRGKRASYLEDDYYDSIKDNVIDVVRDSVRNYYNYDIEVSVQATKDDSGKNLQEIISANYRESSDKLKVSVERY